MLKEASRTSPRDARAAVTQERTLHVPQENFSQQHVQNAAVKQKFLSSPATTDLYIAAHATQQ
jgi:hypothetical protein